MILRYNLSNTHHEQVTLHHSTFTILRFALEIVAELDAIEKEAKQTDRELRKILTQLGF